MHFQILHFFILIKWINLLEMSLGLYSNQGKKTVHNCSKFRNVLEFPSSTKLCKQSTTINIELHLMCWHWFLIYVH